MNGGGLTADVRLVRQEHDWGCGVAALAMVTGQTYDEVRTWILDHRVYAVMGQEEAPADWLAQHGVTQYVLDWYLGEHGFAWRRLYRAWVAADSWPPKPFAPVHVAQVIQPSGMAHFVVLTADGRVLDPMSDAPRTLSDWERINFVQGFWSPAARASDGLAERVRALADEMAQDSPQHTQWWWAKRLSALLDEDPTVVAKLGQREPRTTEQIQAEDPR